MHTITTVTTVLILGRDLIASALKNELQSQGFQKFKK